MKQIRLASDVLAGVAAAIAPVPESADETEPANLALALEVLTRSSPTSAPPPPSRSHRLLDAAFDRIVT